MIKYNGANEIEWVFSPRYDWNNMPEEIRNMITKYYLKWDFFGKYVPNLYNHKRNGYQRKTFL
jgi:hypothetical protein